MENYSKEELSIRKAKGFDLTIDAITLLVLIISAIVLMKMYKNITNGNYVDYFSSCLVYIVPCVTELLRMLVEKKYDKEIIKKTDKVFLIIGTLIGVISFLLLIFNESNAVAACCLRWGILVYPAKYAINIGEAYMDLNNMNKVEKENDN